MPASTTEQLLTAFRAGDRRACARVMSLVEDATTDASRILNELYPSMGGAFRVGVTGPPGAGKSTLVERLALACRERGMTVGIVAVDPTSPFSGGAILGDRVRMPKLFTDPGVFIRSMASRGGLGGLALRTKEVCDVLDAFGRDIVFIETVGVGQIELDVASASHSTVVVLVPESGDAIQVMKAGLMEIGEVFCVNKSERQGSEKLVVEVQSMLSLRAKQDGWEPPVIKTVATTGDGIPALLDALERHRAFLLDSDLMTKRKREGLRVEIVELVEERLRRNVWTQTRVAEALDRSVEQVMDGKSTPYMAAEEIVGLVRPET